MTWCTVLLKPRIVHVFQFRPQTLFQHRVITRTSGFHSLAFVIFEKIWANHAAREKYAPNIPWINPNVSRWHLPNLTAVHRYLQILLKKEIGHVFLAHPLETEGEFYYSFWKMCCWKTRSNRLHRNLFSVCFQFNKPHNKLMIWWIVCSNSMKKLNSH